MKVILVYVETFKYRITLADKKELCGLVSAWGAIIAEEFFCKMVEFDPGYLIKLGKRLQLCSLVTTHQPAGVIFSCNLTPIQEKNLSQILACPVIDYTRLILDIFALRAHSFAGKLQVTLAKLEHEGTRLVKGWTHLERQRGGVGLRSGPGETQLESDRRRLRQKVTVLKGRLNKLRKQRIQNRIARKKNNLFTVALVGYTNAGKSSLFNRLVSEKVPATSMVFTTLDPLVRKLYLADFGVLLLVDTVGFIRNLPHQLVDAFHATLEETREADLLLHVVDVSDEEKSIKINVVNQVLADIGASEIPQLMVMNKVDLLSGAVLQDTPDFDQKSSAIWTSVTANYGISNLLKSISAVLSEIKNKKNYFHRSCQK